MFRNLFRIDKTYWLLVIPILHAFVPWVQFRMRGLIPFFFSVLWLLPKLPRILTKMQGRLGLAFAWAMAWFAFIQLGLPLLFSIIGKHERPPYYLVATIVMQIIFCLVAYYSVTFGKRRELRFLFVVMIGALMSAGLSALRGLNVEGLESARSLIAIKESTGPVTAEQMDIAENIVGLGLGGYGHMYLCAWIMGVCLFSFCLVRTKMARALIVVAIGSSFLCIKSGGLGTPMAIFGLQLMVFVVWRFCKKRIVVTGLATFLVVIFFILATCPQVFSFMSEPLLSLSEYFKAGSFKERIVSLADSVSGDKASYAYERAQLQLKSLDAFGRNFFTGVYGPTGSGLQHELGGHSYILDLMGAYGLVGLLTLIFFVIAMSRYLSISIKSSAGERWRVISSLHMGIFVFSGVANPVTFSGVVVLLIFCLATIEAQQPQMHLYGPRLPPPMYRRW